MSFSKLIFYLLILEIIWISRCSALFGDFDSECDEFYNNSCFKLTKNPRLSWEGAIQACNVIGGYLTSIHSEDENEMLANLTKIRNVGDSNVIAWIGLDTERYSDASTWVDGSPVTYRNSLPYIQDYSCITINNIGSWTVDTCTITRQYICRNTGSGFAIKQQSGTYQYITTDDTIITLPTTLACRTDSYPQTEQIMWEYKPSGSDTWSSITGNWNPTLGISELTVMENGSYRCNVTTGGNEQMNTASTAEIIQTTISTMQTGTAANIPTPTTNTTNTTSQGDTKATLQLPIIVGAVAGFVIISLFFIAILAIIIIIIVIRKRKPKQYEYLSKVKYSNSLSLAVPPTSVRPYKKKNDKITYEYLKDVTPGIDISEKQLMEALEDTVFEVPESIYTTNYVNLPIQTQSKKKVYYEDITEFEDPRLEPINLNVYKQHLTKLVKNSREFEEEYKNLGSVSLRYPCENAVLEHNKAKNKYKMIFPYDKSRVTLPPIGSQFLDTYINASFIPGCYCSEKFIAAQAPKENTVEDFWRMIMEFNVTNIVMLTNIIEGNRKKCEMYFPLDSRTPEQFGSFNIRQTKAETFLGYIVRVFQVTDGKKSRKINHFHFTAWPDHDVPTVYDEFLSFSHKVHNETKGTKSHVLVHCSAGVGRTGTFIAIFNILSAIEISHPVSIYKIVHEMREHRPQMVQTFRQYKFIHLSVAEMLFQDTSIEASNFTSTYKQYIETDMEGYESILFQQYNELNFQTDQVIELSYETGVNPHNAKKNPAGKIYPYDDNRVVLLPLVSDNDYINASYIFNLNFIATIHPNSHTLPDLLQMITQTSSTLVIMLTTRKEKSEIEGKSSKCMPYWGKTDESVRIHPFTVRNTHSEKSTSMIKQNLTIENPANGTSHSFTQMTSLAWNDKGEPTDLKYILGVLQAMREYKQENPHLPIIIHCSDGIGKTGVMLSTYRIIEHIKNKDSIDIFHVIKGLRSERMNFVPSLNHFLSCFALVNEYCSTTI